MMGVRFSHAGPIIMTRANILDNTSGRIYICNDIRDTEKNEAGEECYKVRYYGRDSMFLRPVKNVHVIPVTELMTCY